MWPVREPPGAIGNPPHEGAALHRGLQLGAEDCLPGGLRLPFGLGPVVRTTRGT